MKYSIIKTLIERIVAEEVLSADERCDFGIPKKEKFPMPDENHVCSAISYFHTANNQDKLELAKNILKYAKKYKMDYKPNKDSQFGRYCISHGLK